MSPKLLSMSLEKCILYIPVTNCQKCLDESEFMRDGSFGCTFYKITEKGYDFSVKLDLDIFAQYMTEIKAVTEISTSENYTPQEKNIIDGITEIINKNKKLSKPPVHPVEASLSLFYDLSESQYTTTSLL
ncbi:7692_t:CDS:2 [Ambispora leptoticha]|uniref:7692_t:CDS:1 n=1 Tax=Ambispora leptoticha TaxID=144679 RepID=A0A9N8ZE59_9GLOM|nr:7692_t:CDS:2 [Ambispora leptoticha]